MNLSAGKSLIVENYRRPYKTKTNKKKLIAMSKNIINLNVISYLNQNNYGSFKLYYVMLKSNNLSTTTTTTTITSTSTEIKTQEVRTTSYLETTTSSIQQHVEIKHELKTSTIFYVENMIQNLNPNYTFLMITILLTSSILLCGLIIIYLKLRSRNIKTLIKESEEDSIIQQQNIYEVVNHEKDIIYEEI
jgi:hypothetical protein